jgi:uncharacterized membrane protein
MRKTLSVAFSQGLALTGNWRVGGALAIIEPLCNTPVFYFHEKFWHSRQNAATAAPAKDRGTARWHAC